jgi:hypothetical protein
MSFTLLSFPSKILAAPLSSTGTRLILPDIKHWDGNDLTSSEVGTVIYATLMNFNKTKMEIIELDASTLSVATTTGVLINKRALGFTGGTTASVETAYNWSANESYVQLGSNPPQYMEGLVDLDESQTITGIKTFANTAIPRLDSAGTYGAGTEEYLATKRYADALAIAGAPNATTTQKGIVEQATVAEIAAGEEDGGTGAKLVATPKDLAAQIQSGSYLFGHSTSPADTYTVNLQPALTSLTDGSQFLIKFDNGNTGACTLNINGLGAMSIKKNSGGSAVNLELGDIANGQTHLLRVASSSVLVLMSLPGNFPSTAILNEMSTFFGATDITGAEAEELTNGSKTILHAHKTVKASAYNYAVVADGSAKTAFTHTITGGILGAKDIVHMRVVTIATLGHPGGSAPTATLTAYIGSVTGHINALSIGASSNPRTTTTTISDLYFVNSGAVNTQTNNALTNFKRDISGSVTYGVSLVNAADDSVNTANDMTALVQVTANKGGGTATVTVESVTLEIIHSV